MQGRLFALSLMFAAGMGSAALAQAPQGTPPPVWPAPQPQAPPATIWPDPPKPPAQRAAPPARTPPPAQAQQPRAPSSAPPAAGAAPRARKPAERARTVACAGPFARAANHAQLESAFGAKNVVFTQVDGPGNTKLNASVIFPDDPKRRLEVLWHDEAARARPSAIVITGASQWQAPGGLRLGMTLVEIERRNGKAFQLSGFAGDYGGSVTDWDAGKLDQLPGDCRMGMRFVADGKAAREAVSRVAAEETFSSAAPEIRAVRPRVYEIIIGYGE